jgi:hypothetical protein
MTWAVDPQLFQWLLRSSCPMVGDLRIPGLRLQFAFPFWGCRSRSHGRHTEERPQTALIIAMVRAVAVGSGGE